VQDRIVFAPAAAGDTLAPTIDQGASPMAVLDHHDQPKELNGYLAVFNVSLVFIAILVFAYIFSRFI
jgi:hypothetical protein